VFFFLGMAVERFIIDRRFIRQMTSQLATLRAANDFLAKEIDRDED